MNYATHFYRLPDRNLEPVDILKCKRFPVFRRVEIEILTYVSPDRSVVEVSVIRARRYFPVAVFLLTSDAKRWLRDITPDRELTGLELRHQTLIEVDRQTVEEAHDAAKLPYPPELARPTPDGDTARPGDLEAEEDTEIRPVWDREARQLRYGEILCREYRREAPAQFQILDLFQAKEWPHTVPSPWGDEKKMGDTVRNLNHDLTDKSPVRFKVSNGKPAWSRS
jgi:hypothetical protein